MNCKNDNKNSNLDDLLDAINKLTDIIADNGIEIKKL